MFRALWDSLSTPAKALIGITAAETVITVLQSAKQEPQSPPRDPRKENLRKSSLYADPMVAFYNLTPENQQKVLAWAKQHNLTIEEVIRRVIDQ